jgi:hypothetical protein
LLRVIADGVTDDVTHFGPDLNGAKLVSFVKEVKLLSVAKVTAYFRLFKRTRPVNSSPWKKTRAYGAHQDKSAASFCHLGPVL